MADREALILLIFFSYIVRLIAFASVWVDSTPGDFIDVSSFGKLFDYLILLLYFFKVFVGFFKVSFCWSCDLLFLSYNFSFTYSSPDESTEALSEDLTCLQLS